MVDTAEGIRVSQKSKHALHKKIEYVTKCNDEPSNVKSKVMTESREDTLPVSKKLKMEEVSIQFFAPV